MSRKMTWEEAQVLLSVQLLLFSIQLRGLKDCEKIFCDNRPQSRSMHLYAHENRVPKVDEYLLEISRLIEAPVVHCWQIRQLYSFVTSVLTWILELDVFCYDFSKFSNGWIKSISESEIVYHLVLLDYCYLFFDWVKQNFFVQLSCFC